MRRRPWFLAAVLVLLAVANVYGLALGLTRHADLVAQYPRLADVWGLYLATPILALVAIGALWRWRRWGFWLAVGVATVVVGLELYGCGPSPHTLRVPASIVLLSLAVRPVWRELRPARDDAP